MITRAAGTEPTVEIDTATVQMLPGDLYLLCSDGLTTMVGDRQILEIVEREADPERITAALVSAANRAGGEDNVTVVVFETVASGLELESGPDGPTAENVAELGAAAPVVATTASERPLHRHGAGNGGRALALLAIVVAIAIAVLLIWLGLR